MSSFNSLAASLAMACFCGSSTTALDWWLGSLCSWLAIRTPPVTE